MNINLNGREYKIPVTFFDISIGQRAEYETLHGLEFSKQFHEINKLEDAEEKDHQLSMWFYRMLADTISFYCGIPLDIVEQTRYGDLVALYEGCIERFVEDVDFEKYEGVADSGPIEWKGEVWEIAKPEVTKKGKMLFGEFIDAKQTDEDLFHDEERKWQSTLMLCCIFFRKKGEKYNPEFVEEGSERYELIKTLPLVHAIKVGFFLQPCLTTFQNTFRSFGQLKQKRDGMYVSI